MGTKTESCRLDQVVSNAVILKQTVKDKLKQGMSTRSSTEAEVVATDEIISPIIWS